MTENTDNNAQAGANLLESLAEADATGGAALEAGGELAREVPEGGAPEGGEAFPLALSPARDATEEEVELIAQACHAANAGYCDSLGDFSYGRWDQAPEAIRESCRDGVRKHLDSPRLTPEDSHEAWAHFKAGQGYRYGPTRNEAEKLHPCMVPYADLPQAQRSKDYVFRSVVHGLGQALGVLELVPA